MDDYLDDLAGRMGRMGLNTVDVTLLSHDHGRQRRRERGIERLELQAAIKHGRKERAHPGRDGAPRWRFTHKNVVYITDETTKHEVTSWRLDDAAAQQALPPYLDAGGGFLSHTVLVVDRSGSMRGEDIPGYATRTAAVYECLAREFVIPQLELSKTAGAGAAVVTLIEMSDEAEVLLERVPINDALLRYLRERSTSRAASHGNYLPALDKALDVLRADAAREVQLFLIFLSSCPTPFCAASK